MSERAFQKAVCDYLTLALAPYQGFVSSIPGGDGKMTRAPGYVSGLCDVLCVVRGRPIMLELKTPKGRVKPHQKAVHEALERAGALVFVVRDLAEVEGIVAALRGGIGGEG